MHRLVLFASGSGSNVENICRYFEANNQVKIVGVITNNPRAGVLERCEKLEIPAFYINSHAYKDEPFIEFINSFKPDLIVLAGFLKKISARLVHAYEKKIINIHPALLPKYGGKGMYGMHVHHAVIEAKERISGITIHYVNAEYDKGACIAQYEVDIDPSDTADLLAQKIHQLEYEYFPKTIETLLFS